MPKLIENAYETILEAAREELKVHPDTFNMRNVAKSANMAVGTIYHYFPDKINLIASILLADWRKDCELIQKEMCDCKDIRDVLLLIHHLISDYRMRNLDVFQFYKGQEVGMDYPRLHSLFVLEIESLLEEGKNVLHLPLDKEKDLMIAEMILIESKSKDISFDTLADMVEKTL